MMGVGFINWFFSACMKKLFGFSSERDCRKLVKFSEHYGPGIGIITEDTWINNA